MTAEFAVALPAVLVLLAFLLAGAAAGITQLRLEEAARAGARALARGEDSNAVQGIVVRLAGEGATAVVGRDDEWLTVTASARVGGALGAVIPWTLTASASAKAEVSRAAALGGGNGWQLAMGPAVDPGCGGWQLAMGSAVDPGCGGWQLVTGVTSARTHSELIPCFGGGA
ncbi:TadE family type IV pilus minor pilin [Paenarthrobacter sp. NPDC092416]|uniref:TadE family type IV pilus minor pilin n=1 Tax=Paenarthrobacter sp. NPDC092416 TaxID=3364386 RepID=UPI0038152376